MSNEPERSNRPSSNFIQEDAIRGRIEARLRRVEENLAVHADLMKGPVAGFNVFFAKLLVETRARLFNNFIEDVAGVDPAHVVALVRRLAADGDPAVVAPFVERLEEAGRDVVRVAVAALDEVERGRFIAACGDPARRG